MAGFPGTDCELLCAMGPQGYEVSWSLYPHQLRQLVTWNVDGEVVSHAPVLVFPTRNDFIVVPDGLPDVVAAALDVAKHLDGEHPRPFRLGPWTFDDVGRLVPWQPPAGHPLAERIRECHAVDMARCYETQRVFLMEAPAGQVWVTGPVNAGNCLATNCAAIATLPEGELEGGTTVLLPQVEMVGLIRETATEGDDDVLTVPMDALHQVCDLQPWAALSPHRWAISTFPDAGQWEALRAFDVRTQG